MPVVAPIQATSSVVFMGELYWNKRRAANDRIGVHVVQFFFHFSRTVDVEVLESLLPEGLPFLSAFVETK